MASSKEIKIFAMRDTVEKGEGIDFPLNLKTVETISRDQLRDMTIHGLYLMHQTSKSVMIALETVDNQIDFNLIHLKTQPGVENELFGFEFHQMREVVGRDTKLDDVTKLQICFSLNQGNIESFAIALRKSGNCDFYYQLAKVASYE